MSEPDITVRELQDLLERGAPVRVFDIRSEDAHREWRVPGSEHLPWPAGPEGSPGPSSEGPSSDGAASEGPSPAGRSPGDRSPPEDGPVVVVCDRGRTSRPAAEALRERWGVQARSLEGGMAAWSLAWNAAAVSEAGDATSVLQLRRTGKGCLSYLVASEGEALALDPSLEVEVYLDEAGARGWTLVGVAETHLHADHVSRARRLADAAGAPLHLPAQERAAFPHRPVREGDRIPVGSTGLGALHTPGHTGESHCYLLDDRYLFTGDTLFLEAVGRPDLEARGDEDAVRRHAGLLFRSLSRIARLESDLLVLPAHTDEPVPFDGEPVAATLGEVRERVEAFGLEEEAFVARLVAEAPPTPRNYQRIVELNESGEWPAGDLLELEAGANRCAAG